MLLFVVASSLADAQSIGVFVGDSARVSLAPNAKLVVPVRIDLSNASGGLNIAALEANVAWNASRLRLDSLRPASGSGLTVTSNTSSAAAGSLSFDGTRTSALAASSAVVNLYFTAQTAGGTRVTLSPTAASNALGASILAQLRATALDVCVALPGRWGDANADGAVNVLDAQQIARASVGFGVPDPTAVAERGDVTADGAVNILDAQQTMRFSVGLSSSSRAGRVRFSSPSVASVVISPSEAQELLVGSAVALTASARDEAGLDHGGCAQVVWSTSSPEIASVSADGVVRAGSSGVATVTAASGGKSAQTTVTVTAAPVTTGLRIALSSPVGAPRYYVIVDSGGLSAPLVSRHDLGSARVGSVDVAVPAGTGYRVRVAAVDSLAPDGASELNVVAAAGRVSGVGVEAGVMTPLGVSLEPVTLTYTHATHATSGPPVPVTAQLIDPAELFDPSSGARTSIWYGSRAWTTNGGGMQESVLTGGVAAAGVRSYSGTIFSPTRAGVYYAQASVSVSQGGMEFSVVAPRLHRAESLTRLDTRFTAPFISVLINPTGSARRLLVIADSGSQRHAVDVGVNDPYPVSASIPVSSPGLFRIRVAAFDSVSQTGSTLLATLKATGVQAGVRVAGMESAAWTEIHMSPTALGATWPVSVPAGEGVPITAKAVDIAELMTVCTLAFSDSASSAATNSGTIPCALGSADTTGARTIDGAIPPASTARTNYVRLAVSATHVLPDLRTIQFNMATSGVVGVRDFTTGIRVILNAPSATSRFFVRVDGGGLSSPLVRRVVTSAPSAVVDIAVPAGTGYRVRVIGVDQRASLPDEVPLVRTLGVSRGISVSNGALTPVEPILRAPEVVYGMPRSVLSTEQAVGEAIVRLSAADFAGTAGLRCTAVWSEAQFADLATGLGSLHQPVAVTDTSASCAPRIPAQGSERGLRHQLRLDLEGFQVDGFTVTPRFVSPSSQRGETLEALTVEGVTSGVSIEFTSPVPARRVYAIATRSASPATDTGQIMVVLEGRGLRSGTITLPLPSAKSYDLRLVAIDSASWQNDSTNPAGWVLGASGKQSDVSVPTQEVLPVSIAMAAPVVAVDFPDSLVRGTPSPGSITVSDPADLFGGWSRGVASTWTRLKSSWNRNAPFEPGWSDSSSVLVGPNLRRWDFVIPAQTSAWVGLYFQAGVRTSLRLPDGQLINLRVYGRNLAVGEGLYAAPILIPTPGIRLDVRFTSEASRVLAIVESGPGSTYRWDRGVNVPSSARSASIPIYLPVGTGYRVRVLVVDARSQSPRSKPLIIEAGHAIDVSVSEGYPRPLAVMTAPLTMRVGAPVTRDPLAEVPFAIELVDPSKSTAPSRCQVSLLPSTESKPDFEMKVVPLCAGNYGRDSVLTVTSTFAAVAESGVLHYRISYGFEELFVDGERLSPRFIWPSSQRGEAPLTITTRALTTGVTLRIDSSIPTSRFLISIGGGAIPFDKPLATSVSGESLRSATLSLSLPPADDYVIKVAAVDTSVQESRTFIRGTGSAVARVGDGGAETITVSVGPVALYASVPAAVVRGGYAAANLELTDPGAVIARGWYCIVMGTTIQPLVVPTNPVGIVGGQCAEESSSSGGTYAYHPLPLRTSTAGPVYIGFWTLVEYLLPLGKESVYIFATDRISGRSVFTMNVSP